MDVYEGEKHDTVSLTKDGTLVVNGNIVMNLRMVILLREVVHQSTQKNRRRERVQITRNMLKHIKTIMLIQKVK